RSRCRGHISSRVPIQLDELAAEHACRPENVDTSRLDFGWGWHGWGWHGSTFYTELERFAVRIAEADQKRFSALTKAKLAISRGLKMSCPALLEEEGLRTQSNGSLTPSVPQQFLLRSKWHAIDMPPHEVPHSVGV